MKTLWNMLCALLATSALSAHAQMDTVERFAGLRVEGNIEFQDYDFSRSRAQSDGLGFHSADVGELAYALALPVLHLETSNMTASGHAGAEQTSVLTASVLGYSARAVAGMDGEAAIGALFGHALGRSNFHATFGIASDSTASLHMASTNDQPGASFSFRLVRQGDGVVIWDKTTVAGSDGEVLSDFTTTFMLAPGFYELSTTLLSQAGLDPTLSSSMTDATASFQLAVSAVPEVSSIALVIVGLIAVLASTRRLRSAEAGLPTALGKPNARARG
jgi:hypothetical protein